MADRYDFNVVLKIQVVHQPIIFDKNFPQVWHVHFGNDSAHLRKPLQQADCFQNSIHDHRCKAGRRQGEVILDAGKFIY